MDYQQIESPLAAFNNFIVKICEEISDIFGYNLCENNQIISDNDSIILFNYIRISKKGESIQIDFKKPLSILNIGVYKTIIKNFEKLRDIYFRYVFILEDISQNHDLSISNGYILSILKDIKNNNFDDKLYFIPFRYKIAKNIGDDETLKNLFNKFTYGIKFTKIKNKYKYDIIRLISSDLNESRCIANIRPLEIDTIVSGFIPTDELNNFLNQLMYYGNITNITSTNI